VLAVLQREPVGFLQGANISSRAFSSHGSSTAIFQATVVHTEQSVRPLIDARIAAKAAKNFAEADRIRKELLDQGIVLEDKPGGKTEWRRA
jgi:cysteinyl-tRNA synthetase